MGAALELNVALIVAAVVALELNVVLIEGAGATLDPNVVLIEGAGAAPDLNAVPIAAAVRTLIALNWGQVAVDGSIENVLTQAIARLIARGTLTAMNSITAPEM